MQTCLVRALQNERILSALNMYTAPLASAACTSCDLRVNICCVIMGDADLQAGPVRVLQ